MKWTEELRKVIRIIYIVGIIAVVCFCGSMVIDLTKQAASHDVNAGSAVVEILGILLIGIGGCYLSYILGNVICEISENIYCIRQTHENGSAASNNKTQSVISTETNIAEEIRKYKDLYDEGVINEEEFNKQKEHLLNKM